MDQTLTEIIIVFRLSLAFIAGGIIGFERSSRRQVAGLRTHVLIALGATGLMMLSIWIPQQLNIGDPGRIAAQVVSGIGFLGAGAIIRLGTDVKGLTTAASLWLIAAIGLTIGAGMYIAALCTLVFALITLIFLNKIERRIFPDIRIKLLELHYNHSNEPDINSTLEIFKKYGIKYKSIYTGENSDKKTKVSFSISVLDSADISKLLKSIESYDDIDHVKIREKH